VLRLGVCGLALYGAFVERLTADSGQAVEFRRSGTMQVAFGQEERLELEVSARRLETAGVPHQWLDGTAARRAEPGLDERIASALVIDEHGYVRVGQLMTALAAAAGRRRVECRDGFVEAVEPGPTGVRVRIGREHAAADAVVIAAGSWSGSLSVPAVPVRPIRGQIVELRLPRPPVSRIVWAEGCYLVPWADGTVLAGATSEDAGFDESISVEATDRLVAAGRSLVPAMAAAQVGDVRVGLRPAMPDELPVIGPSSTMDGVYFATGHYRHGVLLAPLTAKLMADLVLDGRTDPLLEFVRPDRFGL
jgi:glycine oxidase